MFVEINVWCQGEVRVGRDIKYTHDFILKKIFKSYLLLMNQGDATYMMFFSRAKNT